MFHNRHLLSLLIACVICLTPIQVKGFTSIEELHNDDVHVLLVYTSENNNETTNVKKMQIYLQHFTTHVNVLSASELKASDIDETTHIVYYGEISKEVPLAVKKAVDTFSGPVLVIGNNLTEFSSYNDFKQGESVRITRIELIRQEKIEHPLNYVTRITHIQEEDLVVYQYGYDKEIGYPLFMKKGERFYFASPQLEGTFEYIVADGLHEFIPNTHEDNHPAYIRLEDIHPMTDPEKLSRVGNRLLASNIPFLLVTIPVYITEDTGERVHLSDSPELISVLQELQNEGASVITHGYTHQYRDSETGEGFEFWDVENNQFIFEKVPQTNIEQIQPKEAFPNQASYDAYITHLQEREEEYIHKRLEDGIHELVSHELYPIGFEAPHYTMSQKGYELVGDYYSAIFGQVQYSDDDWEIMSAPPYITRLHNPTTLTLYPETVGYVEVQEEIPLAESRKRLEKTLLVRDSIVSGFYHPYLDVDHLDAFITMFEEVPGLEWIDFSYVPSEVKTSKVHITTDRSGEIHVESSLTAFDHLIREAELTLLDKILWVITVIVFMFVLLFLVFTLFLRSQQRKRLFKERKQHG